MDTPRKVGRPPSAEPADGRLGIRLPREFLWDVRAAAARAHMGLAEYVKTALREKMERGA